MQAPAVDRHRQSAARLVLRHHGRQQEASPAQPEVQGPLPARLQDRGQVDVWSFGSEQRWIAVTAGDVRFGARSERALH